MLKWKDAFSGFFYCLNSKINTSRRCHWLLLGHVSNFQTSSSVKHRYSRQVDNYNQKHLRTLFSLTLFSFSCSFSAMWNSPLSALRANWCINAMLWVTEGARESLDEYGWEREGERWGGVRERVWVQSERGIEAKPLGNELRCEIGKMGDQGKSFQRHKWLRVGWKWRVARKNENHPVMAVLFSSFFFSTYLSLYPSLAVRAFGAIIYSLSGATVSI